MRVHKLLLIGLSGIAMLAQPETGRYIVELTDEPAAVLQAAQMRRQPGQRAGAISDSAEVRARRAAIRAGQQRMARAVAARGGRVVGSVDTALNALFVSMDPAAAENVRQLPGVLRVSKERVFSAKLDRVLALSKLPEAWAKIEGGSSAAGFGMRVAILDSGIDTGHPGFNDKGFTPPDGFPKVSGPNNEKYVSNKVIVVRSYEALAAGDGYGTDGVDMNGHGTNAACASACVLHAFNANGAKLLAGAAPGAFLGAYKVLGNDGSGSDAMILKGIDDAMKDGFDVLNLSLGSDIPSDPAGDSQVKALNAAVDAGYIVCVAAGNAGPDENTMNSPGTAEKVITVGSSSSDRAITAEGLKDLDPNRMSDFSSRGPNPGPGLKPDMVAVGDNFLTADSREKGGEAHTITQGTSFATPTVAGAAALLKAARPGLTAAQYQSILINSSSEIKLASGKQAPVRHQGAGRLDMAAALEMPLAFSPSSVKFGIGPATADVSRTITVTNLTPESVTLAFSVRSFDGVQAATIGGPASVELPSKGSTAVSLRFSGAGLAGGEYHGVLLVKNSKNNVEGRIPYWYGVRSQATAITMLEYKGGGTAGTVTELYARVVDGAGIDVPGAQISAVTDTAGAKIGPVLEVDGKPGVINIEVTLAPGENKVVLTSGAVSRTLTMTGN
jgi:subtilisin family serine protease